MLLGDSVRDAWSNSLPGSPTRQLLAKRSNFYRSQSARMRTRGSRQWWSAAVDPVTQDEMTYECDAKLGRPKEVDCLEIEFGELGADGDKVDLIPAVAKTLSSSGFTKAGKPVGLTANFRHLQCCNLDRFSSDAELGTGPNRA